jgi:hypothetical protein
MAPKIFPQNDEPGDALGLGLSGPPVLTSRRRASAAPKPPHPVAAAARQPLRAESAKVAAPCLPPVVLTLPDESAAPATRSARGADLPNLLSWAAIILGALIAATLIWTAPKATAPPPDVAPAWESPVDHRASTSSAPQWQSPVGSDSSNQAPPAPDESAPPADSDPMGAVPSAVGAVATQSGVRTARAPETSRLETEQPSGLGETTPVGRITNVAVPQ